MNPLKREGCAMKRLLLCALALCLCIAPSLAETMAEGEPLTGALY